MIIVFTWDELLLKISDRIVNRYPASCDVRHELNGRREPHEVIRTVPTSGSPQPYYPRQYPSGLFNITGVEYTEDSKYAPVKIKTDALREVITWSIDKQGNYFKPSGMQIDSAYWLHHTKSSTTVGCIRITNYDDALAIGNIVQKYLDRDATIKLEVL